MCIGCRDRLPQDELLRLQVSLNAAGRERIVIIEHRAQRCDGRSVYCCPKIGCLDKPLKRGEIVIKNTKHDKIIVRLEPRQCERLRFEFQHAARRLRAAMGVGPGS
jgi:predicted RNA-binding protein YlxR (DUF448 family)